jgi:hypothetical protein
LFDSGAGYALSLAKKALLLDGIMRSWHTEVRESGWLITDFKVPYSDQLSENEFIHTKGRIKYLSGRLVSYG